MESAQTQNKPFTRKPPCVILVLPYSHLIALHGLAIADQFIASASHIAIVSPHVHANASKILAFPCKSIAPPLLDMPFQACAHRRSSLPSHLNASQCLSIADYAIPMLSAPFSALRCHFVAFRLFSIPPLRRSSRCSSISILSNSRLGLHSLRMLRNKYPTLLVASPCQLLEKLRLSMQIPCSANLFAANPLQCIALQCRSFANRSAYMPSGSVAISRYSPR